jgi:hypothetical protein
MKRARTAWITGPALVIAWVVLGHFYDASTVMAWLPKWALAAAVIAPAFFIASYTFQGLAGPGKWWKTDMGVNMVWLEAATIGTTGWIAWAAFFHRGELDTPAQAWGYVGGLLAGAAIITWRSVIFFRAYRREPPLLARVRELEAEVLVLRERLGGS